MIGIIAAMESEMAYFQSHMEHMEVQSRAGLRYYTGTLDGKELVVAECGVGKVNAAMHAQIMVDRYPVTALIQTGIAGSLCPEAAHLSIVIGQELVYHDMQLWVLEQYFPRKTVYYSDPQLVALAEQCAPPDHITGRIATGDQFVSDASAKAAIRQAHGALCCEMEGAAIAQTAALNGLPCLILRCISDMADGDAEMTFAQFEHIAAEKAAQMVHRMVAEMES